MKLNSIMKEMCFDKRMVQWGLRYNTISKKGYEEHLKSLPDVSHNVENRGVRVAQKRQK